MESTSASAWIADRTRKFESSGIRRLFELAAKLKDPINLSIGQPDFDVPDSIKEECIEAIRSGKNGYTPTQGIPQLQSELQRAVDQQYEHPDRTTLVTSGTSGGLLLALLAIVNPGDEVVIFDPYFVMYKALIEMVGGIPVVIDTYPDFRIDAAKVADAMTDRTKLVLLNSPANPTGIVSSRSEVENLAGLCQEKKVALISDEIYRTYCYDKSFVSAAEFYDQTLVIDGFSKSHGMTGWRLGFAHGPKELIDTMMKVQQYSFVCAPQPTQWAGLAALNSDNSPTVDAYRQKRDMLLDGLAGHYEIARPDGAFYVFPKVPWGTCDEFVNAAIENNLLIIPGNIFSDRDTHFRISYAADNKTISRGIETLRRIAQR